MAWPDAPPAVATVKTQEPGAVPTDAPAESVSPKADARAPDGAESTARGGEPTTNAGMAGSLTATPMEMLLILALGLAVVSTLSRVVMKIAAARRARVIIDHPESDWVDDQRQHEWRNDQDHGSVDERQEDHSLISPASDYSPVTHSERMTKGWTTHSARAATHARLLTLCLQTNKNLPLTSADG